MGIETSFWERMRDGEQMNVWSAQSGPTFISIWRLFLERSSLITQWSFGNIFIENQKGFPRFASPSLYRRLDQQCIIFKPLQHLLMLHFSPWCVLFIHGNTKFNTLNVHSLLSFEKYLYHFYHLPIPHDCCCPRWAPQCGLQERAVFGKYSTCFMFKFLKPYGECGLRRMPDTSAAGYKS